MKTMPDTITEFTVPIRRPSRICSYSPPRHHLGGPNSSQLLSPLPHSMFLFADYALPSRTFLYPASHPHPLPESPFLAYSKSKNEN